MLVFAGCDKDDTYEVRLEDALMFIDDGNYAAAKAILLDLPQTAEVKEALSNCIAGGDLNLDMFNIILTMDELDDSGDTGSIDMVGLILGDDSNQLTSESLATKLTAANEAIDLYKDIAELNGTGVDGLSADQKLQLGLLSITRTTLTIGTLIADELPAGTPVTLTETWIKDNKEMFSTTDPDSGELESSLDPSADDLARISEDLTYTEYAIDALTTDNDMKDDYQEFKNELDSNGDESTTSNELNSYIDTM